MGRKKKAIGLGDTIEQITEATGIKKVVDTISKVTGWDCGCDKRKETLNKLIPYKKANCLIEEDYNYLTGLFSKYLNELTINQQYKLIEIYERVFNIRLQHSNCSSCWRDIVNELKKVYETFNDTTDSINTI
jgi:hypothetical protein